MQEAPASSAGPAAKRTPMTEADRATAHQPGMPADRPADRLTGDGCWRRAS